MPRSFWRILALSCILVFSGCGESSSNAKAAKAPTGHEDVLLKLAVAAEQSGDLAHAEKLYKQAADASANAMTYQVELAEFYKRNHQERQAVRILTEVWAAHPQETGVLRELANIDIGMGEPAKALDLLNRVTVHDNKDALLDNSKGVALDMLGRYDEAQRFYHAGMALDPSQDITIKANLSMSYILAGSYNKAISLLLPMLRDGTVNPTIRQNLALAYGLKGQSDQALKLGLKDLTEQQAQENLKFYRMIAKSQGNIKADKGEIPVTVKDVSVKTPHADKIPENPFVEEEEEQTPPAQPKKAAQAVPVKPVTVEEEETSPAEVMTAPPAQPKKAALAAPVKPVTVNDDESSEVAAPQKSVLTLGPAKIVQAQKAPKETMDEDEDEDDTENTEAPASLSPSSGALPSPALKP